jgi:hypothetical protein
MNPAINSKPDTIRPYVFITSLLCEPESDRTHALRMRTAELRRVEGA